MEDNRTAEVKIAQTEESPTNAGNKTSDDELSREIHWYVIHTYSGYENKVKFDIERMAEKKGWWGSLILDVNIPVETTIETKDGKKKEHQHKLYPGYVMVKMHINDETWYYVRNTRGVTGFVGTGNTPVPLTDEEVVKMQIEHLQIKMNVAVGDAVVVTSGPFSGAKGNITEANPESNEVVVEIKMFGKITPLRTESYNVQKI